LTDAAEVQAAFDNKAKVIADKDAEIATAQTEKAALATDKATLEAENATLKSQIADLAITPAKLRDAAKAYQAVTDKAKALGVTVTDAMDEAAIQRAVVDAKLGDIAKDWTADQVAISFATLAKDAKANDDNVVPLINPAKVNDAASGVVAARNARLTRLSNAHRAA
jgi:chromosome segregation ATPase